VEQQVRVVLDLVHILSGEEGVLDALEQGPNILWVACLRVGEGFEKVQGLRGAENAFPF